MNIRLAEVDELDVIKNMYRDAIKNMLENDIQIYWDDVYPGDFLLDDIHKKRLYILENNGEIVSAFALCDDNDGIESLVDDFEWKDKSANFLYIARLSVNVRYLRSGIASETIKRIEEIALDRNIKYLRLLVADVNRPAINLYLKNGFNKVNGVFKENIYDDVTLTEYGFEKEVFRGDYMGKKEYDALEYYNNNAEQYFNQTINGNMKENYDRFLAHVPSGGYILDFGCGSGRDSKYFLNNGYNVRAIDGSIEMCKLAKEYIGQDVDCMKFDELNDIEIYDGIWACASIIHVEKENLPDILKKMIKALKKDGVIYISIKKGSGYQIKEGKYYNHVTLEEMKDVLDSLNENVEIVDYFDTLSSVNRPDKPVWVNFVIKK